MSASVPRHCLIVDDDAAIRRIISHSIHKADVSTSECTTTSQVLESLGMRPAGLIFLDLGLGQSDASEVMEALSEVGCDAYIQIVSGRADDELQSAGQFGFELGMRMLPPLAKPFRSADVLRVVSTVWPSAGGSA